MSAPLVLTTADLHALAEGLRRLTNARRDFGVGPNAYCPEISIQTASGIVMSFCVEWRAENETPSGKGEWVIADRYGE